MNFGLVTVNGVNSNKSGEQTGIICKLYICVLYFHKKNQRSGLLKTLTADFYAIENYQKLIHNVSMT